MAAYAVAVIRETNFNDEVAEYLRRIDATLQPLQTNVICHHTTYIIEAHWVAVVK